MKSKKKYIKFQNFVFILFLFVVVFSFIPSELYFKNMKEWGGDYFILFYFIGFGLFLTLLFYFLSYIGCKIFKINFDFIAFWIFIAGLFFLISDIFSPVQLGLLDGTDLISQEPIFYSLLEIFIFLLCLLIGFVFVKKTNKNLFLGFSIATIFIFSGYVIVCVTYSPKEINRKVINKCEKNNNHSDKNNIYHIVLDAMQTDYFIELINNPHYQNKLKGFFLFKNNITNYPYTSASSASYLGGSAYQGGAYYDWTSEHENSLFNLATRKGYDVHLFGKPSVIHASSAVQYTTPKNLLTNAYGLKHPLLKEFIKLWIVRISPNFFTNEALVYGSMIGEFLTSSFNNNKQSFPQTIDEGVEPYTGSLMLNKIIETEKERKDNSIYLYAHPILPHGPYVLDCNCNYSKNLNGDIREKCLGQSECALSLLCKFIDELRFLGRLEKSIVVVHSDHGSGWESNGFYRPSSKNTISKPYREDIGPWSKQQLEARAMAFLMIKPPFSNSDFKIIDANTQNIDIYPTISDYAGFKYNKEKADGISLRDCISFGNCNNLNDRDRFFYFFPPSGPKNNQFEKIKIENNKIGHPIFYQTQVLELENKSIDIGSHIYFNSTGEGSKYLGKGWSSQEESHIWSNAKLSQLKFKLTDKQNFSLNFRIYTMGFPAYGKDPQKIKVYANGEKIGFLEILHLAWYEVTIPEKLVNNDYLNITFEISNPTAPCDFSNSKDCRKLGIAIKEVIITQKNVGT